MEQFFKSRLKFMDDSNKLRAVGARCRMILTAITAIAAAALIAERLGYAGLYAAGAVDPANLARQAALSIPSLFYLAGLWKLRQAASGVARGDPYGARVVVAIRGVGLMLVVGAAVALILPLLVRLTGMDSVRQIDADVSTLVIGAVGAGQILLAGLLRQAGVAERELADLF